jgi:hypothetical protein
MSTKVRVRTRTRPAPNSSDQADSRSAPAGAQPSGRDASDDDDVGYKKPPKHTQFKRGQSGNPRGRPKGSRNLKTELAEELQEQIRIKEGGARRTVSKQRAMIKSLAAKAVQGDARSATLLTNLVLRLLDQEDGIDQEADLREEDRAILENYEARIRRRVLKEMEKKNVK